MNEFVRPQPEPQFGLVDVIEAFTALRHEYRGQTRESRELAKSIQLVADRLEQLEHQRRLPEQTTVAPQSHSGSDTERRFVHSLIEIDLILTRAVDAIEFAARPKASPPGKPLVTDSLAALRVEVTEAYENQGWLARLFGYRYWEQVMAAIDSQTATVPSQNKSTCEGLRMVVTRVRRLLAEHAIERIDTIGLPFDGELMNAVEALDCSEEKYAGKTISSGEVVRQHCPIYRWQGKLMRYAEVSVAK